MLTGLFCIAGSLWFAFELPKIGVIMRPIYRQNGLLPERDANMICDEYEPAV